MPLDNPLASTVAGTKNDWVDTPNTVAVATLQPVSAKAASHIAVSADLSNATWKSIASHEVFNVTGLVRLRMWVECTENVTSALGGATLQFGYAGLTNAFIVATGEDDIDAGELWFDATPTEAGGRFADVVFDEVLNALDVGYEIVGEATTDGTLVFHCVWEPMNATGAVVAGDGSPL